MIIVKSPQHARILVVCATPLVTVGVRHIVAISSEHEICGETQSTFKAREWSLLLKPDVIFLDLSMGGGESLLFLKDLDRFCKATRVLVYSQKTDDFRIRRALLLGARAAICGEDDELEILKALDAVAQGRKFMSASVAACLSASFGQPYAAPELPLTDREHQVFRLLGDGYKIKEIAGRLSMGEKTVESHLRRIKSKLELKDMVALRRRAILFSASQSPDELA